MLIRLFAIVVASLGLLATSANATPARLTADIPAAADLIQKTHGFHQYCSWGPRHYHRHIPGVGNVSCRRGPVYYRRPVYVAPRVHRRVWVAPRPYRRHVVRRAYRRW